MMNLDEFENRVRDIGEFSRLPARGSDFIREVYREFVVGRKPNLEKHSSEDLKAAVSLALEEVNLTRIRS